MEGRGEFHARRKFCQKSKHSTRSWSVWQLSYNLPREKWRWILLFAAKTWLELLSKNGKDVNVVVAFVFQNRPTKQKRSRCEKQRASKVGEISNWYENFPRSCAKDKQVPLRNNFGNEVQENSGKFRKIV